LAFLADLVCLPLSAVAATAGAVRESWRGWLENEIRIFAWGRRRHHPYSYAHSIFWEAFLSILSEFQLFLSCFLANQINNPLQPRFLCQGEDATFPLFTSLLLPLVSEEEAARMMDRFLSIMIQSRIARQICHEAFRDIYQRLLEEPPLRVFSDAYPHNVPN
jgi:hypothetical protein